MKKFERFLNVSLVFVVLALLCLSVVTVVSLQRPTVIPPIVLPGTAPQLPLRLRANVLVRSLNYDAAVRFFDYYSNNLSVTEALYKGAVTYDIPVDWFFALAQFKSRVNPYYKTGPDYKGLFQFPPSSEPLAKQVKVAINVIMDIYEREKDWDLVFIAFHVGRTEAYSKEVIKDLISFRSIEAQYDSNLVNYTGVPKLVLTTPALKN